MSALYFKKKRKKKEKKSYFENLSEKDILNNKILCYE